MPEKSLFDGFPKISSEEWKRKINDDLQGADYEKTLIWRSPERISVQPFYHSDTSSSHRVIKKKSGWSAGHLIEVHSAEEANTRALDSIKKGAESLWFKLFSDKIDLDVLLKNVDIDSISIHLDFQVLSKEITKSLVDFQNSSKEKIHVHTDNIGHLARRGNWFLDQDGDFGMIAHLQDSGFKNVLSIDTTLYQNAGATMVQQLAYALAHCNEYLNVFANRRLSEKQSVHFTFKVSIGSNYFFEIAKLRALRLLWASLTIEYGLSEDCVIMATPSKRNKTIYDYNVNMLRTTTECMSAILGGANILCNQPYDAIYHKPNEFGDRIALNQLLLLKNESYFDKVDNPTEGSYYIESLTQELAKNALELFKKIEASGGFLVQLKEGIIQNEIEESASFEEKRFEDGIEVLVGANKYKNESDKMKEIVEINPFTVSDFGESAIRPIIEKRLAECDEQKRMDDE